MKIKLKLLFIFFFITINHSMLFSEDWSDLDEKNSFYYGSERESKFPINAFFIEREKWKNHSSFQFFWFLKTVDYPKYTSFRLLPFWYHQKSKIDERSRWSIPLFLTYSRHSKKEDLFFSPFYFSNISNRKEILYARLNESCESSYFNPYLYYYNTNPNNKKLKICTSFQYINEDRSLAYLIWWGKKKTLYKTSKYFLFFPLWWKVHIFPTFRNHYHEEVTNFSPFFMFFHDKYYYSPNKKNITGDFSNKQNLQLKSSELLFWAPIIPLVYLNLTPERHRVNIFWLLDYDRKYNKINIKRPANAPRISENDLYSNGYFQRFWFSPFYYYKRGDNGYHFILPPLYMENRKLYTNKDKFFYRHLLPFFIYNNKTTLYYKYNYAFNTTFASRQNEKTLLTLVLYSYKKKELFTETTKIIEEKIFISNEDTSATNNKNKEKKDIQLNQAKYKRVKKKIVQKKDTNRVLEETFWVPILPLYFSSYNYKIGWHKNLLWILDWQKDIHNNLKQLWLAPLFYYSNKVNKTSSNKTFITSFLYYNENSLIIQKNNKNEIWKNNTKANFLFYSTYRKKNNIVQDSKFFIPIIPLYYSTYNIYQGWHKNILWIFDWKKNINNQLSRFFIAPFYYYSYNHKKGYHKNILGFIDWTSNEHEIKRLSIFPSVYWDFSPTGFKAILPFYVRWPGSTKEKGLSFGLFHYYKWDKNKVRYWFLFPLRYYAEDKIKKTYTSLWFPVYFHKLTLNWELSLNPFFFQYHNKKTKKQYYLNILGISQTIIQGGKNISLDFGKNKKGYYIETEWSWLYDVFSVAFKKTLFQKKNTNKEKLNIQNNKYIRQKNNVTFTTEKEITTEITRQNALNYFHIKLLFGLWEFQIIDSQKHFRLLPLTWITWNKKSSNKMFWMLNTLYYNTPKTKAQPAQSYFVFFPLFARQTIGKSYLENYGLILFMREYFKKNNQYEYTFLWPFINFYSSNTSKGSRFLPFYWYKGNYTIDKKTHQKLTYESKLITPLYYNKDVWDVKSNYLQSRFSIALSHFNYFHRDISKERDYSTQTITIPILPIYYKQQTTKIYFNNNQPQTFKDSLSFLLPIYLSINDVSQTKNKTIEKSAFFTLPFIASFKTKITTIDSITKQKNIAINSSLWILFYNIKSSNNFSHSSVFWGLWEHTSDKSKNIFNWKILYGFGGYKNHSYETSSLIRTNTESSTTEKVINLHKNYSFWMAPFFYYSSSLLKNNIGYKKKSIRRMNLLFYYRNTDVIDKQNKSPKDYTVFFPIIPLFYHSENKNYLHTNIFWLLDWGSSKYNQYNHHFMFAPFYFSWQNSEFNKSKVILGLYLTSTRNSTYWNFLYLLTHESYSRKNYEFTETGFLLNSFYYKVNKDYKKFQILYGFGLNYKNYKNSNDYSFSLLAVLYNIEQRNNRFNHSLLGIYHYSSTENSYSLIMPALLSYINKTPTSKTQVIGLGLLWFQYENYVDKTDYEYLLLGIPYYKKTKPERGYVSYGSLWGLLWEYEKETETDFRKFSILKFLYKRVYNKGKITTRILGITF